MQKLELIYAPNPIFRKKAEPVSVFDNQLKEQVEAMFDILYHHQGVGLGANMVGLLKQIIIIDLQPNGKNNPMAMINPKVEVLDDEMQTFTEASLSYPGISAEITRPKNISVSFQTILGDKKTINASGWQATVIQHEIDYLNGKTFLDLLSPVKRNALLRKMKKLQRNRL